MTASQVATAPASSSSRYRASPRPRRAARGDGRVVEPDDALVVGGRVAEVARRQQLVAAGQQALRGLARQATRGHLAGGVRGSGLVHRHDST